MGLESDKEVRLKKYIDENDGCFTGRVFQIEYRGELLDRPIYKIPIDLLTYNLENGRFAADKLNEEAKLGGRKLNSNNEEDAEIIKNLLLEKDPEETKRLKEDLMRIGQKDAGIITVAGNVINANRRMAVLSDLREKTGDEKYGYLFVGILPKGADKKDIWIAESKLQFGKDFKVTYGPINVSLKIREAIQGENMGMKEEEIAKSLSMEVEDVKGYMNRLDLIERYLEYIGKPKEYTYIEKKGGDKKGIYEHFINTLNNLEGSKNDFTDLEDQIKFMRLHFESINANSPHLFIRKLKCFRKHSDLKDRAFAKLDELQEKKINLKDFNAEIKDLVDLAEERDNTDPKRLLQIAYSRLSEFNKRVPKLENTAQRNIFNFIEEIVKEIKGKL